MAEQKLGSRRGKYAPKPAQLTGSEGNYVALIQPKNKDLQETDKARAEINREIRQGKEELHAFLYPKSPNNEIEFERFLNQQVYGTRLKSPTPETLEKQRNALNKQISELRKKQETHYSNKRQKEIARLEASRYALERQGKPANPKFITDYNPNDDIRNYIGISKSKAEDKKERLKEIRTRLNALGYDYSEKDLDEIAKSGQRPKLEPISQRDFKRKQNEIIKENRKNYEKRKPLDTKASELRKKEDTTAKQIYDTLRNARKSNRHEIYINNQPVKFYGDEKNPKGDIQAIYKEEPVYKKDAEGNKVQVGTKKVLSGYQINIKGFGVNPKVKVSGFKEKEKIKYTEHAFIQHGEILIQEDEHGLYVSGLSEAWSHAERKYGARVIYINGIPYTPADFDYQREGGIWYFKPEVASNLVAGIAYLSYTKPIVKERYELATVKEQIAPKPKTVYFEFDTKIELVGKMENVHIAFITKEAYGKLREAVKNNDDAIKAGGSAIWYIIATKFDINKPLTDNENKRLKELNQKSELLMPDKEKKELQNLKARAGFRVLVEISDVMITSDIANITSEENKDRFIILAEARHTENPKQIIMVATIKDNEFEAGGVVEGGSP